MEKLQFDYCTLHSHPFYTSNKNSATFSCNITIKIKAGEEGEATMECSMCGDLGFQVYLFQCTKCLIRFQHRYCSRAYYENVTVEKMSELCDWCFTIQQKNAICNDKLMIRDSIESMRSCSGVEEGANMITHNSKRKRKSRKSSSGINGQIIKEMKKQRIPEISFSTERRVVKKYKLLTEIVC